MARTVHTYRVFYVDNYGEHSNLQVMTDREHDEEHASMEAQNYLCRPVKYIRATYQGKEIKD